MGPPRPVTRSLLPVLFALLSAQVFLAAHELQHLDAHEGASCEICLLGAAHDAPLKAAQPPLTKGHARALPASGPAEKPFGMVLLSRPRAPGMRARP